MTNENSLTQFEKALAAHDWYYDYSDDYSVWQRGIRNQDDLLRQRHALRAAGLGEAAEALWRKHCPGPVER